MTATEQDLKIAVLEAESGNQKVLCQLHATQTKDQDTKFTNMFDDVYKKLTSWLPLWATMLIAGLTFLVGFLVNMKGV